MTNPKTTPSQPTGRIPIEAQRTTSENVVVLKSIYCIPVWKEDQIVLYDMYSKATGEWLGSKRLLKYCEEFDARV